LPCDPCPLALKLRIPTESSRIPKNSGGCGPKATFRTAPNSWEFGYAQLQSPLAGQVKLSCLERATRDRFVFKSATAFPHRADPTDQTRRRALRSSPYGVARWTTRTDPPDS
jgi:hypothetical protein